MRDGDRGVRAFFERVPSFFAALALLGGGVVALLGPADPVSAGADDGAIEQCNNQQNADAQTVLCSVVVVNNLTDDPTTTGSVVTINGGTPMTSPNLVTSVNQCNGSGNAGGSTVLCDVSITNNISQTGASAPTAATVNQCNDNQPDGLGNPTNPCVPFPATTTGATITQCNGSGNGGGLVSPSGCTASGTVSSSLPVTINQCNGSGNGGGGRVVCSATIQTFVVPAGGSTTAVPTTTGGGGSTTTDVGATTTDVGASTTDVGASTTDVGASTTDVGASTTDVGASTTDVGASTTDVGASTTDVGATTTDVGATTTDVGATTSGPGTPGTSAPSGPGLPTTGAFPWAAVFAALLLGLGSFLLVVGRRATRP